MNAEPSRRAAYADLVAAVLDLRGPEPQLAFDAAITEAVTAGTLSPDLARRLRWLQRAGERAMVEHAEAVLPPALVALDTNAADNTSASLSPPNPEVVPPQAAPPDQPAPDIESEEPVDEVEPETAPVVQLQARRLLVAGLRPISDPAHHGTLS